MISKNEIKLIRSLERKKGREETGLFVVEGEKLVHEALQNKAAVQKIFCTDRKMEWQSRHDYEVAQISDKEMQQVSGLNTAPGVLAIVHIPVHELSSQALVKKRVLALDAIRDPGNLGTIIRSADWFGVTDILASEDTVDCFNQKVVQSTMGSLFRVAVHYVDIAAVLPTLKTQGDEFFIYAATLSGEPPVSVFTRAFKEKGVLVIGNESTGISEPVLECCDKKVTIPAIGRAESLNAGISASILLYEWCISPRS